MFGILCEDELPLKTQTASFQGQTIEGIEIIMFNRRYIFKRLVFHCHVSFPGSRFFDQHDHSVGNRWQIIGGLRPSMMVSKYTS